MDLLSLDLIGWLFSVLSGIALGRVFGGGAHTVTAT